MAATKNTTVHQQQTEFFPPVVTVLGHVDHGKTTLLDAIRKTNIAGREHGGITQKIGASSVEVMHDGKKRAITFIDTPGHEAFAKMRSRGAQAADIALLIISSVDGVMPQTLESIGLLQAANLPFIVVLTKSDDPNKNPEKVKQQLLKENIMLEGYGGDVPVIEVSARQNTNIKEMLDLILLALEVRGEKKDVSPAASFHGIVIESRLDKRSGPLATVVIKNGTLRVRDEIFCEGTVGKVRMMINTLGKNQDSGSVGEAVEILGFENVPPVGGIVYKKGDERATLTQTAEKILPTLDPNAMFEEVVEDTLSVVICADTLGSLEAIKAALPEKVNVLLAKTGDITPADVLFAKSVSAIILGFNIKVSPEVMRLATSEKVQFKNYAIIYEMLDEIKDVLEGKRLALIEEILGKAKILATFPFDKKTVLGVSVLEGRVAKGDKVRILHDDQVVGETSIASLRQGKEQVSKVEAGQECGIILSSSLDFTIGDMVLCHD